MRDARHVQPDGARENRDVLQATLEGERFAGRRQRKVPAVADTAALVHQRQVSPISLAGKLHSPGQRLAEHDPAQRRTPELQFDAAGRVGPRHVEVDAAGVSGETRRVLVKLPARDAGQSQTDRAAQLDAERASVRGLTEGVHRGVVDGKRPRRCTSLTLGGELRRGGAIARDGPWNWHAEREVDRHAVAAGGSAGSVETERGAEARDADGARDDRRGIRVHVELLRERDRCAVGVRPRCLTGRRLLGATESVHVGFVGSRMTPLSNRLEGALTVSVPPATRKPTQPVTPGTRNCARIHTVPAGISRMSLSSLGVTPSGNRRIVAGAGLPLGRRLWTGWKRPFSKMKNLTRLAATFMNWPKTCGGPSRGERGIRLLTFRKRS